MQRLKIYTEQDILNQTNVRRFETKIGELVQHLPDANNIEQSLQQSSAHFVIVGVPEEIGVKGNEGSGGADAVWQPFLSHFLNIQSNDFFDGSDVMVLGHFDFAELTNLIESNAHNNDEKLQAYRHAVNSIDDAVEQVTKLITSCKKIPIVVGGGHNNAYGCLKGAAKGLHKTGALPLAQLNAINLDAHAEYRPAEGRHSGNAFRYAEDDGYLAKYCVVGLHESDLPQNCWLDIANNPFMDFVTYEDIFLHGKQTFLGAVQHAIDFTADTLCGIELDMGSIHAAGSLGVSALNARQYVHLAASQSKPAYLHIAQGDAVAVDKSDITGKLASYLASDFIKALQY
ncbi:arginase [Ilyomonas limi]|uniref:Arginase n=1 Tax=Ilyomonas limi TaxID=2575867 RepID=A0A4U3KTP3_9BACT|nr:arginase family protein [Ilyomonas limi]TKK64276.1 arginase [Ilyomonas limi]